MKTFKRFFAVLMCVVLTLTAAPLQGFVGLDSLWVSKAQAMDVSGYKVGDIIEFGSYPQSEVTDRNLKTEILSLLYTKIAVGESQGFVSYGYYSGTGNADGQMKPGDYMKYADVEYEGEKYRGVMFSSYRPHYTTLTCSTDGIGSFQDDNGYYIDNIYWFKYEPLEWRVLDPDEGFLLCENVIVMLSTPLNAFSATSITGQPTISDGIISSPSAVLSTSVMVA